MHKKHQYPSWFLACILVFVALVGSAWLITLSNDVHAIYQSVETAQKRSLALATFTYDTTEGSEKIYIVSPQEFSSRGTWVLVNKTSPLPPTYQPKSLTDAPVMATSDGAPVRIDSRLAAPLAQLVKAAADDGHELMLSSAYQSISEQQSTYDSFVQHLGREAAAQYVAMPGTSEHHTGLAVDFSDMSDKCRQDSTTCNLTSTPAAWLEQNAWRFGFVLRYPEGKHPLTGISFEPWHYRYVGKVLARAIHVTDFTLEEVLQQMHTAPNRH